MGIESGCGGGELRAWRALLASSCRELSGRLRAYVSHTDPGVRSAGIPALLVVFVLFVRSPYTNYIFDEQEALLANPYVNGVGLGFWDVLSRDFWGLPPDRSIGSYRPLPNMIWRMIWGLNEHPWVHHLVNLVVHALNAALLSSLLNRCGSSRSHSWLSGALFLCCAVLTEAVSGVVGLADVLGGLGILLALLSLTAGYWFMLPGVFLSMSLGFFSKESSLVGVALVPLSAWLMAPFVHRRRPARFLRAFGAGLASVAALAAYTETRRHHFPVLTPKHLDASLDAEHSLAVQGFRAFLRWFAQPRFPSDPINNPLVDAGLSDRVTTALRIYADGLQQLFLPSRLSGDYSFPAEIPSGSLWSSGPVLGAACLLLPPLLALFIAARSWWLERRGVETEDERRRLCLLAFAMLWIPVAYFPHSNIPILLPTVRADRFWYVPAIAWAPLFAMLLLALRAQAQQRGRARLAAAILIIPLLYQAVRAREHAFHYSNDLTFWRATAAAVPRSAKAHLNYGVMLGARGRLAERLAESQTALELAPKWPMAHVYYADTLCRLKRYPEAWTHYRLGFDIGPDHRGLIALGIQCMWDADAMDPRMDDLMDLAASHSGSWLSYFARTLEKDGKANDGIEKKYRPRAYDGAAKSGR